MPKKPKPRKRSKLRREAPRTIPQEAKAPKRKHLTVNEWAQLRTTLREAEGRTAARDEALILAMYATGARRDELGVWTLDYLSKLHEGKVYIYRGKGSVAGFVEVPEYVADVLAEWLDELYPDKGSREREAYVFPGVSVRGQVAIGISDRNVYRVYNKAAVAAGLPKHLQHPHVLKRSRGQHLLEGGVAQGRTAEEMVPIIARVLGHKNTAVTRKHYLAETEADKELVRQVSEEMVPLEALKEQSYEDEE